MLRGKDYKEDYKDYKDDYKDYKDDHKNYEKDYKDNLKDIKEDIKEQLEDLMEDYKDYKEDLKGSCKAHKDDCGHVKGAGCLEDCLDNPAKYSCNVFCKDTDKNCYESYKVFNPRIYAKAHIEPQPYRNFFNLDDALIAGTIFKDMYNPYCDSKYYMGGKRDHDE
jgi:Spore coat associated protein JA (CotJA)